MIRSLGFLGAAALALAVSAGSTRDDARALPPPMVNDALITGDTFPRSLGDFGFFRDGAGREPTTGLLPYELNSALFSDGADKLRYIYVPSGTRMTADIGSDDGGLIQFPVGSAIIKTFAFGEGDEQRFIETRVLLNRADGWTALPYRWNEEQTEARLALAGARIPITTPAGEEISYRIPNMNQCKTCHSQDGAIVPIGPKVRNLPRDWLSIAVRTGALAMESTGALLVPPVVGSPHMPDWTETGVASVDARARAYLDINCAHCHKPGGSASNTGLDLRWEQSDPFAFGVGKPPVAAGRGAGGLLVSIAPGEPDQSILVHRMNSTEPGVAMPELGRSTIDAQAVALMREWIEGMEP